MPNVSVNDDRLTGDQCSMLLTGALPLHLINTESRSHEINGNFWMDEKENILEHVNSAKSNDFLLLGG